MQCIGREVLPVVQNTFNGLPFGATTKVMNIFGALLGDEFDTMVEKAEDVLKDTQQKKG